MDPSDEMWMRLATVGIFRDKADEQRMAQHNAVPMPPHVVDDAERALIRDVLVQLGAPEEDIEWLTKSCPALEYALGYKQPREIMPCLRCQGPRAIDRELGCIVCATGEGE